MHVLFVLTLISLFIDYRAPAFENKSLLSLGVRGAGGGGEDVCMF